ncbi:DNA-binding NarL/FixJ family response regulator [Runella defluvii]|uniref:DNA-binding NarL/FixJ family response regulator n=1 Tax=Runella defluvii TaxID=370973 RepID=A0A7W5ZGP9_9BACT|nr:response regulator transcription factor [Runella defluvii]MBB3836856.1 DNA-binding NarL/FixJ family response regulator [Runella defluvii]
MANIRVAITDDQVLFRRGMASIINTFENISIVLEADNGRILLDSLQNFEPIPDVVLLDLSMPELNGIETTKLLHVHYPSIKIIILSVYGEDRFVTHLMELGVNAYLFKNVEPEEVERAIRTVIDKDFYFNEAFLNAMKNRLTNKRQKITLTDNIPSTLTSREMEVLSLICKQRTAQEIADQLFISVRTVDGHRNNLLEKTGARNSAGLVLFAIKHRLIDPTELL